MTSHKTSKKDCLPGVFNAEMPIHVYVLSVFVSFKFYIKWQTLQRFAEQLADCLMA
jgi:hypothetical protein